MLFFSCALTFKRHTKGFIVPSVVTSPVRQDILSLRVLEISTETQRLWCGIETSMSLLFYWRWTNLRLSLVYPRSKSVGLSHHTAFFFPLKNKKRWCDSNLCVVSGLDESGLNGQDKSKRSAAHVIGKSFFKFKPCSLIVTNCTFVNIRSFIWQGELRKQNTLWL